MQRVRIGLTGLACVFLLVLLAASIFGYLTDDDAGSGNGASANAAGTATAAREAPKEPLAELGIAPGYAADADKVRNSTAPPRR